jgi:hypothetical protein
MRHVFRFLPVMILVAVAVPMLGQQSCIPNGCATLTVHNDTSLPLVQLFVSPVEDTEWTGERLGGNTVESGESRMIEGIDPHDYDLMAVFSATGAAPSVVEWEVAFEEEAHIDWYLMDDGSGGVTGYLEM